ncbi:hypothetical protein SCAR479_11409 [Seiridium cardinale]|uniref:Glycosyltransferase family 28 N-terminal domain-containing protein n=1 Tax=Seiridium cardinale TaxID=138064 RepID=A0ABR2XDQ7_9PEZI
MLLGKFRFDDEGHLDVGDELTRTTTQINNDGRATVKFHRNPTDLAAWFKRVHDNTTPQTERKVFKERKGSNAFLDAEAPTRTGPRLNIAIQIVGSRGDVQPFIPIAQLLSKPPYGHRVRVCTHPVFKDFVEKHGLEFFSIGGDPEALMAYMVKNPGLIPGRESLKAGDIGKRRREMAEIMEGAWRSCIEAGDGMGDKVKAANVQSTHDLFIADAIIANPPSMAHIHCAEKLGIPLHMVFTMPWSPTHTFHHPLAAMQYGQAETSTANWLSFKMMELLTWQGLGDVINDFRARSLELDPISPLWGFQLLDRLRLPFTYLWSQSLIPKPADWADHINIVGFSFLPQALTYEPPAELESFLSAGPPPIYIGFGSIVVDDPQALTALLFEAVKLSGVRAIVSKGWAGISGVDVPDNVYLIGDCPHDWLFRHVTCVVHHGGAGTTAAGLAAGCATVVVSFFGDQAFWGQMIARANAGPEPIPFKKLTAQNLADSIEFALRPEVQAAAKRVALQVAEEDGASNAANDVLRGLDATESRCDICPERLAVYKHEKTGAHLSSFATYCLLNSGIMKVHDLRLLRHKHWYVDEGAENVSVAIVATFSGFFMEVARASHDYKLRLKKDPNSQKRRQSSSLHVNSNLENERENGAAGHGSRFTYNDLDPRQLEKVAKILATRQPQDVDALFTKEDQNLQTRGPQSAPTWVTRLRAKNQRSRPEVIARASGQFVGDLMRAGLKTPVALLYNTANGFRNFPSYISSEENVHRRDEITGMKSGFKTAGKECVVCLSDAFGGLVLRPYNGAKKSGAKGFGKGVGMSVVGFIGGVGGGIFSLPGYSLKGIEKSLHKRRLTELKAEFLLIRMRQGLEDYQHATEEERRQVTERWKSLHSAPEPQR